MRSLLRASPWLQLSVGLYHLVGFGQRRITADTALRFSAYFGNTAKFWPGLQDDNDIEEEKEDKDEILIQKRKTHHNTQEYDRSASLIRFVAAPWAWGAKILSN